MLFSLYTAADVGLWHQLGRIQHHWSDEFHQIHLQGELSPHSPSLPSTVYPRHPFILCSYIHVHVCSLSLSLSLVQRIGYLAAAQCFHDDLDVVMLTTNMIRKDISSPSQYDSSLALNGLACFMTPDLARYCIAKKITSGNLFEFLWVRNE